MCIYCTCSEHILTGDITAPSGKKVRTAFSTVMVLYAISDDTNSVSSRKAIDTAKKKNIIGDNGLQYNYKYILYLHACKN